MFCSVCLRWFNIKDIELIGKAKTLSNLICWICLFILVATWCPPRDDYPSYIKLLPSESHSGCSQFLHHQLWRTVLYMSPRLQVSRVPLSYKWNYLIMKHRYVNLYWITKQRVWKVVSIHSHSMVLLKENKSLFTTPLLHFFTLHHSSDG